MGILQDTVIKAMITLVLPAIFLITTIPNIFNLRSYQTRYDTLDIKKESIIHIKNSLQSKKLQKLTPTPTLTPSPTNVPTPILTPTPTVTPRPIPSGYKGFLVSSGNKIGPRMSRGFIDPYNPTLGETQTLGIAAEDSQSIISVKMTVKTDHKRETFPMTLVSGTTTNGRWERKWDVYDTYLYYYHVIFEAVGSSGTTTIDVTLR